MIMNCQYNIVNLTAKSGKRKQPKSINDEDINLWDSELYPREQLIDVFQSCIDLNYAYMKQYESTKEYVDSHVNFARKFDFDPAIIFGQFDLFCKRIGKLIEIFGTVH